MRAGGDGPASVSGPRVPVRDAREPYRDFSPEAQLLDGKPGFSDNENLLLWTTLAAIDTDVHGAFSADETARAHERYQAYRTAVNAARAPFPRGPGFDAARVEAFIGLLISQEQARVAEHYGPLVRRLAALAAHNGCQTTTGAMVFVDYDLEPRFEARTTSTLSNGIFLVKATAGWSVGLGDIARGLYQAMPRTERPSFVAGDVYMTLVRADNDAPIQLVVYRITRGTTENFQTLVGMATIPEYVLEAYFGRTFCPTLAGYSSSAK